MLPGASTPWTNRPDSGSRGSTPALPLEVPRAEERTAGASAIRIAALVFLGYYVGARLGLSLTNWPNPISALWPPNAILLAALLLLPTRRWPLAVAAALPAHLLAELQAGVPLPMVLCWFVTNATEALFGAGLLRWQIPGRFHFDRLRNVLLFILFAAFLGPFLTSFLDIGLVLLNDWGAGEFTELWRFRFFSNVLATLTLVPVIVAFGGGFLEEIRRASPKRRLEAAILFAGLLAACYFAFNLETMVPGASAALVYLPLPFVLWSALRVGPGGVGLSFATVALMVVWGTGHGRGPFATGVAADSTLSAQLFLIFVAPMLLALAALLRERETSERQLRVSEERFAKAFRSSPDAMAISRLGDDRLLDVNDRWVSLFGHRRDEAIGHSLLDLLGVAPMIRRRIERQLDAGVGVRDLEIEAHDHAKASLHVVLAMEPVEIGDENGVVITVRDITAQRRAELEARERRLELTHLSRVNLLGELSGSLAHELNQPLTAILSNAQAGQRLLERQPIAVGELAEILTEIVDADQRAGSVIRRLRALLRKDDGQLAPLQLNRVLDAVLEIAHGDLITRNVTVSTRLEADLPLVAGDRVQLQQLFLNLLANACDAMNDQERSERLLTIVSGRANGAVRIAISDRGHGIPENRFPDLFEPFFTTKENGLGLGLAICRTIASVHGGRIWAENGAERGATFFVELPLLADLPAPEA